MLKHLGLLNDRSLFSECFCGVSVQVKQLHWCFRCPDVGECVYNTSFSHCSKMLNWKLNSTLFTASVLSGFAVCVESHCIYTSFSTVLWSLSAASLLHSSHCRKSNLGINLLLWSEWERHGNSHISADWHCSLNRISEKSELMILTHFCGLWYLTSSSRQSSRVIFLPEVLTLCKEGDQKSSMLLL